MKPSRLLPVLAVAAAGALFAPAAAHASGPPSSSPSFGEAPYTSLLDGPGSSSATSDLDGDGDVDIVALTPVANTAYPNSLVVMTNDGSGVFSNQGNPLPEGCIAPYEFFGPFADVLAGDLIPGGSDEILVRCSGADLLVGFQLTGDNDWTQIPSASVSPSTGSGVQNQMVLAVIDGQAALYFVGTGDDEGELFRATATAEGFVVTPVDVPAAGGGTTTITGIATVDVGGVPHLLAAVGGVELPYLSLFLPGGEATFLETGAPSDLGIPVASIQIGDLNADGRHDITILVGETISTWLQGADGTFPAGPESDTSLAEFLAMGSTTGGCYDDLVYWAGWGGSIVPMTNVEGLGAFAEAASGFVPSIGNQVENIHYVDVTGDGRADLIWSGPGVSMTAQLPLSPVIDGPVDATATAGSMASFTVSSDPVGAVQWQIAPLGSDVFTDIPGATSATYEFVAEEGANGTRYRALVTAEGDYAALSCPAALTVTPAPTPGPTPGPTPDPTPTPAPAVIPDVPLLPAMGVDALPFSIAAGLLLLAGAAIAAVRTFRTKRS